MSHSGLVRLCASEPPRVSSVLTLGPVPPATVTPRPIQRNDWSRPTMCHLDSGLFEAQNLS